MNEDKGAIKKIMIILSKGSLENVYAAFVLANGARMEGIAAEIFFTFFGLEAIHKKKLEHLHVATVGNPAMHMPTMLGGLPGMEALASNMMKKEMEKIDMPEIPEFLDILTASGVKMWACKLAVDMFHYTRDDLYEGVEAIITVGDFYKESAGEGVHMLFI
ncbi:DsrE/DsrF/DrsH-like family protein [Mucilaginibacter sp.]|uniref:DsrE/DsrF/DrsH-like family protein n=1 Tax=Mucilaginibacter sp. TaxID=1882438 RepID=UPI00284F94D4|nr:DsrE/DsrF/DrsH-like family protein [Mucilaginibacter sp.]MDR3696817.1 DsrE/DsrF/DrsH-like family protein [Mucilaginibacter sp.]